MSKIQIYGWKVSPFTEKTYAYLKYKQLDPKYIEPNAWQLNFKIKKDVGQMIMPVVYDDDQILQDSSAIIDYYESHYASRPVIPEQALPKIACYILELLGDEWLTLAALHYRWHYPENHPFIFRSFGRSALPKFPPFMQSFMGRKIGKQMSGYLPILGIDHDMQQPLESNTHTILSYLNEHLASHTFLFGSCPSLADFAIYGPIYAHLYRDPFPDKLLSPYPSVIKWIQALSGPINLHQGNWSNAPTLPLSLLPLLQVWSQTHAPLIKASIESFKDWCICEPNKTRLPRAFGKTTLNINGQHTTRLNLSYVIWMWQRIQKVYQTLSEKELNSVDSLLNQLGVLQLMQTPLPKKVILKQCRLHLDT